VSAPARIADEHSLGALESIERRVLWLAVRIVDYANRERAKEDELKVGGHQASSASIVTLMTALYFADLDARDRLSVKPHGSPVLHAIDYLLGRLPREYLTTLRDFGGLQAYPSRTKDPFAVDFSTGSVGLGSTAPLFGALADRYVEDHFGLGTGGRFISLLGDAELDEGTMWEAAIEPATRSLGNVLWIVDLNRQSLDRVVPVIKSLELQHQFEAIGWRVLEIKYGRRLQRAFEREDGELLRRAIDEMPNQVYQTLFGASEEAIVQSVLDAVDDRERGRLARLLAAFDGEVGALVQDLGGHDLAEVTSTLREARADTSRPTVVFAYTVKGYGLPIAGRPQNHSALLTGDQIDDLRTSLGLTVENEWNRFEAGTPEAEACEEARQRLDRLPQPALPHIDVPATLGGRDAPKTSTQAAFGRILLDLSRLPGLAERLVTVSPDVSASTNLGGWINKVGVWSALAEPAVEEPEPGPLRWNVSPQGQHIELGISEMNLFLLLGQLGLTHEVQGQPLFAIGTLYDPFVVRGLEAFLYGTYSGSRFVVCGTPSGISLSREGGAHQSTVTPGIGIELPGVVYAEPCYARELEWLLLEGLRTLHEPDGEALYLRLSTVPIEQSPFTELVERAGEESVRANVLRGGYRLREPGEGDDAVAIATCGTLVPQALEAARMLEEHEGVAASVVVLSSPDRLYRGWRAGRLRPLTDGAPPESSHLGTLFAADRGAPVVSVIDGASHSLAWLGSALGVRGIALGVDRFGQTGSQPAILEAYGLSASAIATAALVALEPGT
jgi:pyruvate dehydrogenase E1 component